MAGFFGGGHGIKLIGSHLRCVSMRGGTLGCMGVHGVHGVHGEAWPASMACFGGGLGKAPELTQFTPHDGECPAPPTLIRRLLVSPQGSRAELHCR